MISIQKNHILIIIVIIFAGFLTTFASGYLLKSILVVEPQVTPSPSTTASPTPEQIDELPLLPGQTYLSDTLIAIAKTEPHVAIAASATRAEYESAFNQTTRISFFDGEEWSRERAADTGEGHNIYPNSLITNWVLNVDPSRVLKESVSASYNINGNAVSIASDVLNNEIGMRSLPGYTKFMSSSKGTISVNGVRHEAYILYTKIYSLNAKDIQFYDGPLGVTTDWLAFWSDDGTFFHLDMTEVKNPTPLYQTHQIGVMVDTNKTVTKTFTPSSVRSSEIPPLTYTFSLGNPINAELVFNRENQIDKEPGTAYDWFMGTGSGTITLNGITRSGIGIVEFIRD